MLRVVQALRGDEVAPAKGVFTDTDSGTEESSERGTGGNGGS